MSFIKMPISVQQFSFIHEGLWILVSQKTSFEGDIGEKKNSLLGRIKRVRKLRDAGEGAAGIVE